MSEREQPKDKPDFVAFAEEIRRAYYRAISRWLPSQPISEATAQRVEQAVRRFWRMMDPVETDAMPMRAETDYIAAREQLELFAKAAHQLYKAQVALNEIGLEALDDQFLARHLMPDDELKRLSFAARAAAEAVAKDWPARVV
jgi:hypothetical protein